MHSVHMSASSRVVDDHVGINVRPLAFHNWRIGDFRKDKYVVVLPQSGVAEVEA